MNQEEKVARLFTQGKNGEISQREITREEQGEIFFHEGCASSARVRRFGESPNPVEP